jgi:hypothetical protein
MRHLICGAGEVGGGLFKVIGGTLHDPYKHMVATGTYDVLHICIPHFPGFVKTVKAYQKQFKTKLTIIHSTVPVGTSRKCGAVHSPIRGVHPDIDKGIRTFVKYFGGKRAKMAASIFQAWGIQTYATSKPETTEALKLWDTTQYGMLILMNRQIKAWCKKHKVDFDVMYTHANQSYNAGYVELGRPEVVRPWLKHVPGKIGGHCVRQNAHILDKKLAKLFDASR